VQFLENAPGIDFPDEAAYNQQCASWNNYYENALYPQFGSGL